MSSTAASASLTPATASKQGLQGWLAVLSPRDRIIYGVLMTMVLAVIGIYMVLAVRLLINMNDQNGSLIPSGAAPPTATATAGGEASLVSGTVTPTPAQDNDEVAVSATRTPRPTTEAEITATPDDTPTANPTATTTNVEAPAATTPIAANRPEANPPGPVTDDDQPWFTLYFLDETATLFVPLSRPFPGAFSGYNDADIALIVIKDLIAGPPPQSDLRRSVEADVSIREIRAEPDRLIVNFSSRPADDQELRAIALSLTELPNISRVLFQYNGTTITLPGEDDVVVGRFPFNVYNPRGLPEDFGSRETSFLSLYFLEQNTDSRYVRVTRLVERTFTPARDTVEELLDEPIPFNHLLESPIPSDTRLLSISFDTDDDQLMIVNLSQDFATAKNQRAALETLVLSLTDLRNADGELIERVTVQVEGDSLGVVWGAGYDRPFFERPVINPDIQAVSLSGM
jgi:spore germination protein GerM